MQVSMFGLVSDGESAIDATIDELAQLSREGFSRVWMGQWPMHPDLLTILAVALREIDTIEVASGVIPIQNQHPMLMAQRALTLSAISAGRFILGLGVTHAVVSEQWWGIPWNAPVRRLDEYLDGLLPLLAGESADVVGRTVTARGALDIRGAAAPDVYVAALGPRMLNLAGARTSGTFTWMTGADTLANYVVPSLRRAAERAGRAAADVRVVAGLPICVTDHTARARAHAAEHLQIYGTLPSYRAMLDRQGLAAPEDAAIIGDETTVRDELQRLRATGIDEYVAVLFDPDLEDRERTRRLLREFDTAQ